MLERAVRSVFGQRFNDFELIVIDDGSSEDCSASFPKDARIQLIRNSSNLGVGQTRNLGIEAARGTYVCFLDDDDEYLSSFLSTTYASLKDTPERIGIAWCGVKFIDHPSEAGTTTRVRIREFGPHQNQRALLDDFLQIGMGWGVTIKRDCLRKVGGFNHALRVEEDTDLFLRILENGFLPIRVNGVHVVCHNHQGPRLKGQLEERLRMSHWLLRQHSTFLDNNPTLKNHLLQYVEYLKKLNHAQNDKQIASTLARQLLSRFHMIQGWLARGIGRAAQAPPSQR